MQSNDVANGARRMAEKDGNKMAGRPIVAMADQAEEGQAETVLPGGATQPFSTLSLSVLNMIY